MTPYTSSSTRPSNHLHQQIEITPLPGDNIKEVDRLLRDAIQRLKEKGPEADLIKVRDLIWLSADILQQEETDIVRWGDVTKLTDDTFEPYNSIKIAIHTLRTIDLNKLPTGRGLGDCLNALNSIVKTLARPIQEQQFFSYL